ncbi:MAG: four helix bundle protein [Chitinophagaceae bacterium]
MEDESLRIVEEEQVKVFNIRHRCFYFSKDIITFIKTQKTERLFYPLFSQLLRSATSIGANIVEGSAGSSNKDFVNFHTIALKSANETKYWLCLIRDTMDSISQSELNTFIKEADEISKIIAKIILNVKTQKRAL